MLRRVRRLSTLPSAERALALQALGTLSVVRLSLWMLPFRRVRALVDRWASNAVTDPDLVFARAVRRAVDRAARTLAGSDCLPQALTAEVMLRRAGVPARVSIGVSSDGQLLSAHAWVESAGFLVTGDSTDIDQYRTLVVYGSETKASVGT
ncbi:MAG: lasso peptide biosynthesis B2 protein [Gemmatimonadaceae bacterium]